MCAVAASEKGFETNLRQSSTMKISMAESNKHTITSQFEVKMRQVLKSNFHRKCAKMELW